ncbi:hypothetical protein DPMN_148513 [Dreissena polymorpha]|uniref:Uncharacterized protein n=1 Tax=Dreissena polymorpha TaxID=45954 RepID=A0A9D4FE63_DREPO|nr:hypothetical protein DPMN_148513 [Dreissena polymorpha]
MSLLMMPIHGAERPPKALEAELDIDQLVDNSVGRRQRNQYRECDRKIFYAWRKYEAKDS